MKTNIFIYYNIVNKKHVMKLKQDTQSILIFKIVIINSEIGYLLNDDGKYTNCRIRSIK